MEFIEVDTFDEKKQEIINLFRNNIKYKIFCNENTHCGSEGHWLEDLMNIKHNNKNEPDINGFEMKKDSSKITFGDFSASEYLFSKNKNNINKFNNWENFDITRNQFINIFGSPNLLKNNRYSWSGSCVPTYDFWNKFGQNLLFDNDENLCIYYSYEKDTREIKNTYPEKIKKNVILIVIWNREKLKSCIENKFNKNGFFICKKINNIYEKICFGNPFNFKYFIENIKNKNIIFDSGMYDGNLRNYSQFRSKSNFWNSLITEEYL